MILKQLFCCLAICGRLMWVHNRDVYKERMWEYLRGVECVRNYENKKIIEESVAKYKKLNIVYANRLQSYTVFGDYLNFES